MRAVKLKVAQRESKLCQDRPVFVDKHRHFFVDNADLEQSLVRYGQVRAISKCDEAEF
jgi:hypothetical protein